MDNFMLTSPGHLQSLLDCQSVHWRHTKDYLLSYWAKNSTEKISLGFLKLLMSKGILLWAKMDSLSYTPSSEEHLLRLRDSQSSQRPLQPHRVWPKESYWTASPIKAIPIVFLRHIFPWKFISKGILCPFHDIYIYSHKILLTFYRV